MYLTRQADYTMRLLIHLAIQPDGTATIKDVAEHYGISRNHLMKVANRAVRAGYVEAVRGREGGLKLAKPAGQIGIGEVLRATEDWTLVECFEPASNACPITSGCGLRPVLKQALDAYFAVLDRYSLADIARRRTLLVQLLGLETA
ncbi:MAG: Rrf2 family transcriptional regulator [Acidobacteriota bacterium]|nr:Rrf2 family transcriptional regulator [Acidobacteriota bacterium]